MLKKLKGEGVVNGFFQDLETVEFPAEKLKALYPQLVGEWEVIAKLESVPWPWVCLLELSLAGFLAPTACLYPIETIPIYSLTWPFLLHPGSTQTSGLLRLYQDVLDEVERKVTEWRREASATWKRDNPAPPAGVRCPFDGAINLTLGSGSLEGEGKVASQTQNLGRACGFLTEGKRFFSWLAAEGTLNETIVTELYERAKWRRVTLDGTRSFTIMFPFFGVCGSIHVEDIAFLWAQEDALGLRGRVRFMYCRPSFKRAVELREANAEFNADRSLLPRMVDRFMPVHYAHSLDHSPREHFEFVKNYPFRVYSLDDAAKRLFDATFDHHVAKQEENYLLNHAAAKQHGKKKTSNLRFALQVHLREQARLGKQPQDWSALVPAAAVEFADAFGGFLDALNEKLDGFFSTLHASDVSGAPRSVGPGGVVRLQNWSSLPLDGFKAMSAASRHFYIKLLQLVLKQPVAWFTGSAFRSVAEVKESMEALDMPGGRVACVLFWSRFPRLLPNH